MTSITYIGMDVHTTNYTLCCYTIEEDKAFATVQTRLTTTRYSNTSSGSGNSAVRIPILYAVTKPVAWGILCITN